jgi:ribosomal protein L37AE/L43A
VRDGSEKLETMTPIRHPCPCCGHQTLDEPSPGSWLTCPVCGWLDEGGAGLASLERLFVAQRSYLRTGSSSDDDAGSTRPPRADELKRETWQPLPGVPDGLSPKERERELVKAAVIEAFAGVTSEGRASLGEAYRADYFRPSKFDWDDYDTHWRQIPDDVLTYFSTATNVFTFGNIASFRYYLPAYILLDLRAGYPSITPFALDLRPLAQVAFVDREEVRILDSAQRAAVVLYLQYALTFWGPDRSAERALTRVWLPSLEL